MSTNRCQPKLTNASEMFGVGEQENILRIKINIPQRGKKTSVILCVNYIFHNLNILSWDSGGRRVAQQRESACFALAWLQSVHETFARMPIENDKNLSIQTVLSVPVFPVCTFTYLRASD